MTGAEVIEGDLDAKIAELRQDTAPRRQVVESGALGYLEGELATVDARRGELIAYKADQPWVAQLRGRHVHRHESPRTARGQLGSQPTRLADQRESEPVNQAGLLQHLAELARRDGPLARMLPSHQGLAPNHRTRHEIDDRLVVLDHLPRGDGP